MTNGACQLGGYILCLLAGILSVIAVGLPFWSRDTKNNQVIESIGYSYGLWWKCVYTNVGTWQCDAYDRIFLGMPAEISAARGLSVVGCVLWAIMMVLGVFGLECTTWKQGDSRKGRMTVFAGIGCIISGICLGIAASMWAYRLVTDFYGFASGLSFNSGYGIGTGFGTGGNFGFMGQIMEPGASCWLLWFACVMFIVGGLLMICGSRREDYEDDEEDGYRRRTIPNTNRSMPYVKPVTSPGRQNPGFIPDSYNRNTNLPNRVYI